MSYLKNKKVDVFLGHNVDLCCFVVTTLGKWTTLNRWFVFLSFLVASFNGLRPVLVASHCSLRSLANKLRSFVRMILPSIIMIEDIERT